MSHLSLFSVMLITDRYFVERGVGVCDVAVLALIVQYIAVIMLTNSGIAVITNMRYAVSGFCHIFFIAVFTTPQCPTLCDMTQNKLLFIEFLFQHILACLHVLQ